MSQSLTSMIALRQKYLDALNNDDMKVTHSVDGHSYDYNSWREGLLEMIAKLDKQIAARQPFAKRMNQRSV